MHDWLSRQPVSPLCRRVFGAYLESSNAVPLVRQSLLAQLVQIAGGGFDAYWEQVDSYRCRNGNSSLIHCLAAAIGPDNIATGAPVIAIKRERGKFHLTSANGMQDIFDQIVLAAPPGVWESINLGDEFNSFHAQMGMAVKHIAWLQGAERPRTIIIGADITTAIWPAMTSGTMSPIVCFTGAGKAQKSSKTDPSSRRQLYERDLSRALSVKGIESPSTFVDWVADPFSRGGYSFPAPGEITRMKSLWEDGLSGLNFAGEHTCYPFVGFMEGALRSGLRAAEKVAERMA